MTGKPWAIDPRIYSIAEVNCHKGTHTWTEDALLLFQSGRWLTVSRWSGSETLRIKMRFVR